MIVSVHSYSGYEHSRRPIKLLHRIPGIDYFNEIFYTDCRNARTIHLALSGPTPESVWRGYRDPIVGVSELSRLIDRNRIPSFIAFCATAPAGAAKFLGRLAAQTISRVQRYVDSSHLLSTMLMTRDAAFALPSLFPRKSRIIPAMKRRRGHFFFWSLYSQGAKARLQILATAGGPIHSPECAPRYVPRRSLARGSSYWKMRPIAARKQPIRQRVQWLGTIPHRFEVQRELWRAEDAHVPARDLMPMIAGWVGFPRSRSAPVALPSVDTSPSTSNKSSWI